MSKINKELEKKFGSEKIKFDSETLIEYGQDWYKGIEPDPQAIFFSRDSKRHSGNYLFCQKKRFKTIAIWWENWA